MGFESVKRSLISCFLILFFLFGREAFAQESYSLKIHHFFPPGSIEHINFFLPWADALEEESDGRIKAKVYPSMMLGGSPRQLLDQLNSGVADIVFAIPSYSPGSMIGIEVFELPFVHKYNMLASSMALQTMVDDGYFDKDFKGNIYPLFLYVHRGNSLHCIEEARIDTLEDLVGKRVRTPSRSGSQALVALGASPVSMAITQVRHAMLGGIVDCALLPFTGLKPASIEKNVVKYQTFVGDNGRKTSLGTLVLGVFIRKDLYEGMPSDFQRLIKKYMGTGLTPHFTKFYTKESELMMESQLRGGSELIIMSGRESQKAVEILQAVTEKWVENAENGGMDDPREILSEANARIEKFDRIFPLDDPEDYVHIKGPFPKEN